MKSVRLTLRKGLNGSWNNDRLGIGFCASGFNEALQSLFLAALPPGRKITVSVVGAGRYLSATDAQVHGYFIDAGVLVQRHDNCHYQRFILGAHVMRWLAKRGLPLGARVCIRVRILPRNN